MIRIGVTGSNGFIGRELVVCLQNHGIEVISLARRGESPWCLGERLPDACSDASAVIHLASATLTETASVDRAASLDVAGTRLILDQVREWRRVGRRQRFVFLSSQSSRASASNAYGRSKWRIEAMLDQPDEVIVRPGLVYSDPPASVYATFDMIARLPIVPIVRSKPGIQPICVRELAECLIQIALMEAPPGTFQLGAIDPLSFEEALRATARRAGRREPLMVPLPTAPIRLVTRAVDHAFGLNLTERVDGLTSLEPFETKKSLAILGRMLQPFSAPTHPG